MKWGQTDHSYMFNSVDSSAVRNNMDRPRSVPIAIGIGIFY